MKTLFAAAVAAVGIAGAAVATPVGFAFKEKASEPGPPFNQDTSVLWTGGGIDISQTSTELKVTVTGIDKLSGPLSTWIMDWSVPMDEAVTFDLYLNPTFNDYCTVLVNPLAINWDFDNPSPDHKWDQTKGPGHGFCQTDASDVVLTAQIAAMPLPAGMALILTGAGAFAFSRRFKSA